MRNLDNAIKKVWSADKGALSEALISRTAKQALNQYARGWIKPLSTECAEAVTALGLRAFLERPMVGRQLDGALTAKGIEWLTATFFKKNGERRYTKTLEGASPRMFDIVRNFSHFTFDGFESDGYSNYAPRWRVHAKSGESFSYVCTVGMHNPNGYVEFYR